VNANIFLIVDQSLPNIVVEHRRDCSRSSALAIFWYLTQIFAIKV